MDKGNPHRDPIGFVGLLGAAILLGTEDSESDIMQTESPFITSFYVSIVCGLSVGYGDFAPSTMAGRGLFIFFIPFSVVTMLKAMEEVNVIVRVARTVTTIEITDIREIMEIDTSGEGQIDMNEYTRYMLCSTGQLEIEILLGFEKQFHALDTSGDGTVSLEDFPEGVGLKKIHTTTD